MKKMTYIICLIIIPTIISCSEDPSENGIIIRNLDLDNVSLEIVDSDTALFTHLMESVTLTVEIKISEVDNPYYLTGYWYDRDGNFLARSDSISSSGFERIVLTDLSNELHEVYFLIVNQNGDTKRTRYINLYNGPDINFNFLAVGQKSTYSFFKECNSGSLRKEIQTTLEIVNVSGNHYTIEEIWEDRILTYDLIYDNRSITIPTSDLDINDQFPSMFAFPKDFSVRDSLRFNLDEVCFTRQPLINCSQLNELGFYDMVCEYGQLDIFQETFDKPLVYMFINRAVFSLTLTSTGEIAVAFVVSSIDRPVSADPNGWLLVR